MGVTFGRDRPAINGIAMQGRCARLALAVVAVASLAGGAVAGTLEFATGGGDAWTFAKRIEGSIQGECSEITITSPAGVVLAWQHDGRFGAAVKLREGANDIQAFCRDERGLLPSAIQQWTVRLRDAPRAWARSLAVADALILDAGRSEPAEGHAAPIRRYEWRARLGNPAPLHATGSAAPLDAAPATGKRLAVQTPAADGEYQVTLRVVDALGRDDTSTLAFRVDGGRPRAVDPARDHPAWVDCAVVYGIVPHLFGPRGFRDVEARLDEIAALGATALWLSPVNASPAHDFGYAVTDHFGLNESLGTESEFRRLVDAAHARGLRVIMDFVPNHASEQHPYYADAAERARASPYFRFFDRGADGAPTHYFDWTHLKNLDFDNPEVRRYVIEAFAHWVRAFDIDGFRVDASWGIRERAPEFWPRWRAELKRIKPDLLLLAEASARDPYYLAHGFDAAYDWTGTLGVWAWQEAFAEGAASVPLLREALTNGGAGYDAGAYVFRFLNNNDTGARFVTRHGVPMTRVAATMLLTLPGIPGIYMGDEVGAEFEPYASRAPVDWTDGHGLREHYARLTALRQAEPALRSRRLALVETSHADRVLAYLRPGRAAGEGLVVLLNYGAEPLKVALSQDGSLAGRVHDVLNGETLTVSANAPVVALPGYGARVLRRVQGPRSASRAP